jgi:hypothetical protein
MSAVVSKDISPATVEVQVTSGVNNAFEGVRMVLASIAAGAAAAQTYNQYRGRGHEAAAKAVLDKHYR